VIEKTHKLSLYKRQPIEFKRQGRPDTAVDAYKKTELTIQSSLQQETTSTALKSMIVISSKTNKNLKTNKDCEFTVKMQISSCTWEEIKTIKC
jgi:hypothetical protein